MSFGSDFVPFTEKVTWKDQNKLVHETKKVYDKNNPPDLSENHLEELNDEFSMNVLPKNVSIPRENICKICNKSFQNLKKHVESVHEKLKKYQCHICGKIFYQKNHLKDHTESVHNKENYEKLGLDTNKTQTVFSMGKTSQSLCTVCGKSFKNPHILKRHVESVHEKLKKYQCDLCGKKCYQKAHLTDHIETVHDGKKKFKCEKCELSFVWKKTLKNHVLFVHEGKACRRKNSKNKDTSNSSTLPKNNQRSVSNEIEGNDTLLQVTFSK